MLSRSKSPTPDLRYTGARIFRVASANRAGGYPVRTVVLFALIQCAFGQQPLIQSIQNGASSVVGAIAPQMVVSIHGSNLATQTSVASQSSLSTLLGGTSVTFNGIVAPLLYVSPQQINAQVPSGVQFPGPSPVVVTTAAGVSAPFSVPVTNGGAPGIFTQDASGCGQAVAFNIHADGSVSMNTPETSLDPVKDVGLTVFLTGLGPAADRVDGAPWVFNPADDVHSQFTALLGLPGLYKATTGLNPTYAGPAPGTVGVDQLNAELYRGPLASPPSSLENEGCRVPMSIKLEDFSATQYVNVSIHSGGGRCVDSSPDSLGEVNWQRTVTSDTNGVVTQSSVGAQFLQSPGLALPQFSFIGSFGEAALPVNPSFCAASYPAALSAGALTISGPGFAPLSVNPQNQNGVLTYQRTLDPSLSLGGAYTITAPGGDPGVGAFTAHAAIPAPITVTTDLSPGTAISVPFTLNWTGGGSDSVITVQLASHDPTQPEVPTLYASARASDGSVTLINPPSFRTPHPRSQPPRASTLRVPSLRDGIDCDPNTRRGPFPNLHRARPDAGRRTNLEIRFRLHGTEATITSVERSMLSISKMKKGEVFNETASDVNSEPDEMMSSTLNHLQPGLSRKIPHPLLFLRMMPSPAHLATQPAHESCVISKRTQFAFILGRADDRLLSSASARPATTHVEPNPHGNCVISERTR